MHDCPVCSARVDGLRCQSCGYSEQGSKTPSDPTRYLCHHEERGQRCGKLGTFSPNIFGDPKGGPHPGPWYCAQHIPGNYGGGEAKRTPEGARQLAAIVEAFAEREAIRGEGQC